MALLDQLEPFRVLIVDDCADMTASMALLLGVWGYEVHVAGDGLAALRLAVEHRVDAVLLDIAMPGLDGWEVAHRLRLTAGLERTWVVAISGLVADADVRRSLEVGCHLHLAKPVDPELLLQLLSTLQREGVASCPETRAR